jgi:hypothetical protein
MVKIRQNVEKGASESCFGKKWIKKKICHIDATHAMHGVDPLLLAVQGTHLSLSSSHLLKQQPIVAISHLPLLDVTNFITAQEVPSPSFNKKEETCVAIHIVSFVCFHHIFLLGHIYFL